MLVENQANIPSIVKNGTNLMAAKLGHLTRFLPQTISQSLKVPASGSASSQPGLHVIPNSPDFSTSMQRKEEPRLALSESLAQNKVVIEKDLAAKRR